MRLLNELRIKNPNIFFLLENVEMGEKWELVLSRAIGVKGIHINSALVSAQNRKRIYWTNIGMQPMGLFGDLESIIEQPKDKGILLKDILQDNPNSIYYLSDKAIDRINSYNNGNKCTKIDDKALCLAAGYYKQGRDNQYIPVDEKYFLSQKMIQGFQKHKDRHEEKGTGFIWQPTEGDKKGSCLRANAAFCPTDNSIIVHNLQKRDPNRPSIQKNKNAGGSGPLSRKDGKTYCLDAGNSNGVEIIQTNNRRLNETIEKHINNLEEGTLLDSYNQDIHKDKSITISTRVNASSCTHIYKNSRIRRLTPIECERLQTVADNYTSCVSDTQRYKMLGNGWTIDVICHILNYLKYE
jgi:DNA (cytosine-5)-methyltransferase 3A